jgi:hypothetical protein
MAFLIKGTVRARGKGNFTIEAQTLKTALRKAEWFRANDFDVKITGPDGEPVEEPKAE